MAGTTAAYGFPYPTGTDSINAGDTKIQELAQAIEDFIDGSEASGKLFNHAPTTPGDSTNRTSVGVGTSFSNVTGASTVTITAGKSGFFGVTFNCNANNTTTAANGWAFGVRVTGSVSGTIDAPSLFNSVVGTSRSSGGVTNWYDSANPGETITLQPQVRVMQTGTTDTIVVYQHQIQVVTFG